MYKEVSEWLGGVLNEGVPEETAAFCFNLYEDAGNNWSMELIGSERFDAFDDDWACDEITDFGTREHPFLWNQAGTWDEILRGICEILKKYLQTGKYSEVLKSKIAVGVGFTDGDIEIIYKNDLNCD